MIKFIVFYILFIIILAISVIHIEKFVTDWTYTFMTCGEAIHRANNSAAPRDKRELAMYNECIFRGIKKWDK